MSLPPQHLKFFHELWRNFIELDAKRINMPVGTLFFGPIKDYETVYYKAIQKTLKKDDDSIVEDLIKFKEGEKKD